MQRSSTVGPDTDSDNSDNDDNDTINTDSTHSDNEDNSTDIGTDNNDITYICQVHNRTHVHLDGVTI